MSGILLANGTDMSKTGEASKLLKLGVCDTAWGVESKHPDGAESGLEAWQEGFLRPWRGVWLEHAEITSF